MCRAMRATGGKIQTGIGMPRKAGSENPHSTNLFRRRATDRWVRTGSDDGDRVSFSERPAPDWGQSSPDTPSGSGSV